MAEVKSISLTCSAATEGSQTTHQFGGNRLSPATQGESKAKSHSSTLRFSNVHAAEAPERSEIRGGEGVANPSGEAHDSMKPD